MTNQETILLAQLASDAAHASSQADFEQLVNKYVQPLLPHAALFTAMGRPRLDYIEVEMIAGVNMPPEIMLNVSMVTRRNERMLTERWLRERAPFVFDPDAENASLAPEYQEVMQNNCGRAGIHLIPDPSGLGTYFCFAHIDANVSAQDAVDKLWVICPILYTVLTKMLINQRMRASVFGTLSRIERDTLSWLVAGRSNDEIARLRDKSPSTVRNQLLTLYKKLGVSSRAEAVAHFLKYGQQWPDPSNLAHPHP